MEDINAAFANVDDSPAEPAQAETPAEPEAPQGALRDPETGQFATQDQLQRKYADRFDTPEELEQSWNEINAKVGSMANEVGQARQQLAQWQQWYQQSQTQQQMPQGGEDIDRFDEWVEQSPQQAVDYALNIARQTGNRQLYDRAIKNWAELDYVDAMRYDQAQMVSGAMQQLVSNLAPHLQPLVQRTQQQEQAAAVLAVQQRHPDLGDYEDAMVAAVSKVPHLLGPLQSGSLQEKEGVIETLYYMARGMAAGAPQGATQAPIPQQSAPAGLAQKIGASVATSTSGITGQPAQPGTASQVVWDLWDEAVTSP